jgi:hypothetical protein
MKLTRERGNPLEGRFILRGGESTDCDTRDGSQLEQAGPARGLALPLLRLTEATLSVAATPTRRSDQTLSCWLTGHHCFFPPHATQAFAVAIGRGAWLARPVRWHSRFSSSVLSPAELRVMLVAHGLA